MQKIGFEYRATEIRKEAKGKTKKPINYLFIFFISMLLILLFLMIKMLYF